ncbi:MAG: hypothetical protein LBR18_04690 [Tannerella sp.]|nr:hypothetical protein [Tannerella sp.]
MKKAVILGYIGICVFLVSSCRSPKMVETREISTDERFIMDKSGKNYEHQQFDTYEKNKKVKKVYVQ